MRKTKPKKRQVLPDPVYGDVRVTKFVNHLMYDGKKSLSYNIFYTALDKVKAKLPNDEKSAPRNMESGPGQHHPSSGSEVSPRGWGYLPGSNRNKNPKEKNPFQ